MKKNEEVTLPKGKTRSPFLNRKLLDEYVKIYMLYFFLNYEWFEITEYMDVSRAKIKYAIKWVSKNFLKIPAKELFNGAIYSIKRRIKHNTELYNTERKKDKPSIRSVVELNREIREDTRDLNRLQSVYQDSYGKIDVSLDAQAVLKLITGDKFPPTPEEPETPKTPETSNTKDKK